MQLQLITAPTIEPITREELVLHLGQDEDEYTQDPLYEALIENFKL